MKIVNAFAKAALVCCWVCVSLRAEAPEKKPSPAPSAPPKVESPAPKPSAVPPKAEPPKPVPPKAEPPKPEPPKAAPPAPPAPAPPPAIAPRKQFLAIPLVAAPSGQPAPSVDCVVAFGPVVPVSAVAFSPDGKILAAAGYQEVLLWDLANAKLLKRIGVGQLGDSVRAMAFSKDGRLLAAAEGTPYASGAVRLLDVGTGQAVHSFQEPKEVVCALALSPDGKLLAAGGADRAAYVWNLDDKKLLATLKEQADWILGVSFSPNGKFLATASADKTLAGLGGGHVEAAHQDAADRGRRRRGLQS